MDECFTCAGKPRDYRSAFGHLAMDPQTGATILEQHRPHPLAEWWQHHAFRTGQTADRVIPAEPEWVAA